MKIAINGFGRIGRMFLRTALERNFDVIAINDLTTPATLAHLFKYDSVHGVYPGEISVDEQYLVVDGKRINIISNSKPESLPWEDLEVDLVVESTGKFANQASAEKHLQAGAKQVLVSAPVADKEVPMVVMGVNDQEVDFSSAILSNASCTTNNVAPMVKILDDLWGIEDGYITTVHSMTGDQNLHDSPHHDLRRARAASSSIIPTSTGAAKAIGLVLPSLKGKLDGSAQRVPTITGSLTELAVILNKKVTVEEINAAMKAASNESFGYTEDEIVSSDIIGISYGSLFDATQTKVMTVGDAQLVKAVSWYDNEMSYVSQLVRTVKYFAGLITK